MDRLRIRNFWNKWGDSFFRRRGGDVLVFLFFLIVSAGFWLLQTLDETFEMEVVVPVELIDVPDEVVVTTPLPEALTVVVKDKGTVLTRYWRDDVDPILISFPNYDGGAVSGHVRIPQADVLKMVQGRLSSSSKVQTIHPDTLEYFYNHGMNAVVPVQITGEVRTDSRYYLYDVTADPAEVNVFAAAATLDTLTAVQTQPLSVSGLRESGTFEVGLRPIRGAKIEPDRVKVTAKVDFYMENTVEIPLVSLNFPGDRELRTFPSTVKVTYTVGFEHNKEVTRDKFVSVITYEEILDLQEHGIAKIPVRLKSIPEGVANVRIEPAEVDFLVETFSED
ncbi:MAG: YbbR-like domain-containing protein [Bacteroidaceae bacterium]|nr:YbbR-like domain-containing protein [Bacteroidaceae bacterium]